MNNQPTPFLNRAAIKRGKRIIVAVVGGTVLAAGFALLVLPGPAFIVIPAGLAILAMQFAWARRWLRKARGLLPGAPDQAPGQRQKQPATRQNVEPLVQCPGRPSGVTKRRLWGGASFTR